MTYKQITVYAQGERFCFDNAAYEYTADRILVIRHDTGKRFKLNNHVVWQTVGVFFGDAAMDLQS